MNDIHADGRAGIDAGLVRRLVDDQFPQWRGLPITPVKIDGWDNRTYRLGDELTVRLPTAAGYAAAVEKEDRWLPRLAPHLPVPIPEPVGLGEPGAGYPFHWSVRRWLDGDPATRDNVGDHTAFAHDVAGFIRALQGIDATGGPAAGAHSFHRGADPAYYHDETIEALAKLEGHVDTGRAEAVWNDALSNKWTGDPVWFHGDIAHGNLLVSDEKLAAVIDFGTSGVGDPACDLVIAWTFFDEQSRKTFREAVDQDEGTWARARGWALWKALILLAGDIDNDDVNRKVIAEILADADQEN